MGEEYNTIHLDDLNIFHITDDPEDVVKIIAKFYEAEEPQGELRPNYEL
jgi:predicted Rossmann-fold nucleotide-binding protein